MFLQTLHLQHRPIQYHQHLRWNRFLHRIHQRFHKNCMLQGTSGKPRGGPCTCASSLRTFIIHTTVHITISSHSRPSCADFLDICAGHHVLQRRHYNWFFSAFIRYFTEFIHESFGTILLNPCCVWLPADRLDMERPALLAMTTVVSNLRQTMDLEKSEHLSISTAFQI